MKYMGSKNRIAKHILPIMLKNKKENQWWIEPFVGGANIIDKVPGNRVGFDINEYLIKALILIRDNPEKIPKNNSEYTEKRFNVAKQSSLDDPIDCLAMFQYSFGCMFKGSWAKNKRGTDYVKECVKNLIKQSKNLQGVYLFCCDFNRIINIPYENSYIYCDPPYKGTAKYKNTGNFNYNLFYNWCIDKKEKGHIVFVSEYNMPSPFYCIWEGTIKNNIGNNSNDAIEKLFTL